MTLEKLRLSDEEVQDIVASLITSGDNADAVYDDVNDTLTVSLSDSISVNTLEATQSITDPEGNTVTSLSDPVRVTEEASTFGESDVTVTADSELRQSGGSYELNNTTIVEGFEDGNATISENNWSGFTGADNFVTNQSDGIDGVSLEVSIPSNSSDVLTATRDTDIQMNPAGTVEMLRTSNPSVTFGIRDSSGTPMIDVFFDSSKSNITINGNFAISYTADTPFRFNFLCDYANNKAEVLIDDVSQGTFSFKNPVSGFGQYQLKGVNQSDFTRRFRIDNFNLLGPTLSGSLLVEWDSGVPQDIQQYDVATFQRTLDSETVRIDIEDGNENTLFSDIGRNFDISTISTDKEVKMRAQISRNDTSNNPTLDYLARRFTR